LYNNKNNPAKPLAVADHPIGEWNTFYIKMVNDRVTVFLNNVLVVDDVVMENYWERDLPLYPLGQIELQAHSTPLQFRSIFIRRIEREEDFSRDTEREQAEGFEAIFGLTNITGPSTEWCRRGGVTCGRSANGTARRSRSRETG
ncbi:MAG: DUF1080 domain-containing protein, partial [Acidobacteria bacterium]|nr:DUF1080 domain-containing protein [Acidobacteriota bacterium]